MANLCFVTQKFCNKIQIETLSSQYGPQLEMGMFFLFPHLKNRSDKFYQLQCLNRTTTQWKDLNQDCWMSYKQDQNPEVSVLHPKFFHNSKKFTFMCHRGY